MQMVWVVNHYFNISFLINDQVRLIERFPSFIDECSLKLGNIQCLLSGPLKYHRFIILIYFLILNICTWKWWQLSLYHSSVFHSWFVRLRFYHNQNIIRVKSEMSSRVFKFLRPHLDWVYFPPCSMPFIFLSTFFHHTSYGVLWAQIHSGVSDTVSDTY